MRTNEGKRVQQRFDSISLNKTYYTEEGYLIDHPIVTTCGVFEYKNSDGSVRRELRLPEHVFAEKSLESYKGKPIIITHNAGEVDKENVHSEQIGTIMSKGYRDGESVRCEIIIHDTNALKRCGLKELSLGYNLDTEELPGIYKGEHYDCIQKNIEINHLALVGEARAGETARLNIDSKEETAFILKGGKVIMYQTNGANFRKDEEAEALSPEEMEAAIALFKAQQAANQATSGGADGEEEKELPVVEQKEKSLIDQVRENMDRRDSEREGMKPEEIIAQQKADLDTLLAEIDKLEAANDMSHKEEHSAAIAKGDSQGEENRNFEKENDMDSNKKGVNMDSIDRMIQERLDICRMADKLQLDGVEKLSVKEGRKRIIRAVNPKIHLDGKSDSYINAAYDIAKQTFGERKSTNDQRQRMVADQIHKDSKEESHSNFARKGMIARMKGEKK